MNEETGVAAQVEQFLAAWFTVRRQIQALNFNRAHQDGLSLTQFTALVMLSEAHDTDITIGWLAQRLNLDAATVVRTVDSLEKRGLASRRRDTVDRRQVFVELTAAGRETIHTSQQTFKDSVVAIFDAMSTEGRAALVAGLEEFVQKGAEHI